MQICNLFIYPIKSCQGIALDQVQVNLKGFLWDREFMLVDHEGKFISQRQYPQLARIQVQIFEEQLVLSLREDRVEPLTFQPTLTAKEQSVQVWKTQTIAIDQGDEVAQWFHQALQLPPEQSLRLVRQSPHYPRAIDARYTTPYSQGVSFADGYPILLTATASLEDLNRRIQDTSSESPVSMNRFRANLVVETPEPFIENHWQSVQVGEMIFDNVKPCSRCIVTTTNQVTGERNSNQEPLRTLKSFRYFPEQGILFGENLIPRTSGMIKVGDEIRGIAE